MRIAPKTEWTTRSAGWPLAAMLLSVPFACSPGPEGTFSRTRTARLAPGESLPGLTSQQRFEPNKQQEQETSEPPFLWDVPEGWQPAPPSQFRNPNFTIPPLEAGAPGGEAYFSIVPGGGDLLGNVNRWRGQVGLGPVEESDLSALPRRKFFGALDAVVVDLEGEFSGPPGTTPISGARMLGVLSDGGGMLFSAKLVGPAALADRERQRFLQFCDSLRMRTDHSSGSSGGDSITSPTTPASTPPPEPGPGALQPDGSFEPTKLGWEVPEGWVVSPQRGMRSVTLYPTGEPGAECWVTILSGIAGGVVDNVNRWRGEVGVEPIGEIEAGALPTLEVLGTRATLMEARGHYQTGMGGLQDVPDALVLGLICNVSDWCVFVKMVGPAGAMEAQREAFATFCSSLR